MSSKENILDPLTWQTSLPVKQITKLADANGLKMGKFLGQGAFGEVNRGKMMVDGKEREVAIKRIEISTKPSALRLLKTEIENMYHTSKHCADNVVQVYDVLMIASTAGRQMPEGLYIIMELIDGIELAKQKFTNDAELVPVLKQLMRGLKCFQGQRLVHADIKPENVMYDPKTGVAKWIDFGLMCSTDKYVDGACDTTRGTPTYIAPELWKTGGKGVDWLACDVWSFGVMIYYLMIGKQMEFQLKMFAEFRIGGKKWPKLKFQDVLSQIPNTFHVSTRIMEVCLTMDPDTRMEAFAEMYDEIETMDIVPVLPVAAAPMKPAVPTFDLLPPAIPPPTKQTKQTTTDNYIIPNLSKPKQKFTSDNYIIQDLSRAESTNITSSASE